MKFLACGGLLLLFLLTAPSPAVAQKPGRLYLFVIADLRDTLIGADKDFAHIQALGAEVAAATGLELVPFVYPQAELAAFVLMNTIDNLVCGPEDVVWFYYSGHGVPAAQKAGEAATFRLGSYNFAIDRVHHRLRARGPGLLLTFFDCCAYATHRPIALRMAPFLRGRPENYRQLFLDTRGDLLVQSNSDEYSYGDAQIGGLFTYAFRRALSFYLAGPPAECSWNRIMAQASRETAQMAAESDTRQVPFYLDNLRARVLRLQPKASPE